MPTHPTQDSGTLTLESIEFESATNPTICLIVLHGLGADKTDLIPLVKQLVLPGACRFVFVDAPIRPISLHGQTPLRAWYDISSSDLQQNPDLAAADEAVDLVHGLIEQQRAKGIQKTLVLGFSQGGVVAIRLGLKYCVDGVIALSAYLLKPATPPKHSHPWFLAHGQQDPVVPFDLGKQAQQQLKELGCLVAGHSYPMEHSISAEEIRDLNQWLLQLAL